MIKTAIAGIASLLAIASAFAQVPNFPQTLPANTVVGRLGVGAGPSQAIPFSSLAGSLLANQGTLSINVTWPQYGADPTGVKDSTGAIKAAISTGQSVYIPTGTYKVTGSCFTISTVGQKIYGDSRGATIISSTCTGNTFTVARGANYFEFRDMTIKRTGVAAVAGQDGIHCNALCDEGLIQDVWIEAHYNGFRLAGAGFAKAINIVANNNINHGIYLTNADECFGLQWTIVNALSQQNNGDGLRAEAVTCSASTGELLNLSSFANKGNGARFLGANSGIAFQGPRMFGGFIGQDCADEIYLDTYASTTQRIEGVFIELAGTAPCGINSLSPATLVGHGILATANNTELQVANSIFIQNSQAGIASSAARLHFTGNNLRVNGGSGAGNERAGILVNAGNATINGNSSKGQVFGAVLANDNHVVVGNDFTENSTAPLFAVANLAVSMLAANLPQTTASTYTPYATPHGDSIYSIQTFDRFVYTNTALTAPRTWTLPAANAVAPNTHITISDLIGGVTSTNTLTIARAGADTINGAASVVLANAFDLVELVSDGTSKWTYQVKGIEQGGTGAATASAARTALGISATGGDTTYNFRTNNLSDVANAGTARTNLGVTATGADTTYNFRANNLSDVASASTARTNLGVTTNGSAAVGQLPGTTTNDSASAGNVGEYIASVIASGSAVSLTTSTPANLTSISLTAGDWDVDANFCFTGNTTTNVFNVIGSISQTTATLDFSNGRGTGIVPFTTSTYSNLGAGQCLNMIVPPVRFSLASTTTIFGVASSVFTTSTNTVFGILRARRVR